MHCVFCRVKNIGGFILGHWWFSEVSINFSLFIARISQSISERCIEVNTKDRAVLSRRQPGQTTCTYVVMRRYVCGDVAQATSTECHT